MELKVNSRVAGWQLCLQRRLEPLLDVVDVVLMDGDAAQEVSRATTMRARFIDVEQVHGNTIKRGRSPRRSTAMQSRSRGAGPLRSPAGRKSFAAKAAARLYQRQPSDSSVEGSGLSVTEQRRHLRRRVLLHRRDRVRVDVERHLGRAVTEPLRHHLHVDAGL